MYIHIHVLQKVHCETERLICTGSYTEASQDGDTKCDFLLDHTVNFEFTKLEFCDFYLEMAILFIRIRINLQHIQSENDININQIHFNVTCLCKLDFSFPVQSYNHFIYNSVT